MSEWKSDHLGNYVAIQTGPFGSLLHAADYVSQGIPSIMPVNIGAKLDITSDKLVFITEFDAQRLSKYLVTTNDIVYSRRGDVEKCAFITDKESGWLCGTGCLRVRITNQILDPKFCAFQLSTDEIRSWVSANAVGTTMPNLNSTILKSLPIVVPPLPEQKAIASVLSSLDDKIDLLHRQNKTLEAMAETLFRQWFIEEAKEDWEDTKVLDLFSLVGGGTPKTSEVKYWDGDIPWLSGGDIANAHQGFIVSAEKSITDLGLEKSSTKLLPKLASIISARGTVGKYAMLSKPMTFSQSNYGIVPKGHTNYYFVYLLLVYIVDELSAAAYGSVFDTITTRTFEDVKLKLPLMDTITEFESGIAPLFEKKLINVEQIQTLEKLRDTLLPKLMSGEVRVEYKKVDAA